MAAADCLHLIRCETDDSVRLSGCVVCVTVPPKCRKLAWKHERIAMKGDKETERLLSAAHLCVTSLEAGPLAACTAAPA